MYSLKRIFVLLFCLSAGFAPGAVAAVSSAEFIRDMAGRHGFDRAELEQLLAGAAVSEAILSAISKPAERRLRWHEYRAIFIKEARIKRGVEFWRANRATLRAAQAKFGVPAEIITAIIGVETFYGRIAGRHRVLDALHTLAFHYPRRAGFFRGELEQFLLMTREQGLDPRALQGSYAGAMGMPQFIASSYRHYAVDFDADGRIDIWNNPADVIGSVANYLAAHGWQPQRPVIARAEISGQRYKHLIGKGLKPDTAAATLRIAGVSSGALYAPDEKLRLFEFELADKKEYWLAHHNFYVITRYNHSALYALAVYQLARALKARLPDP